MQRLLESFGPIQQLLTFWDKQYLFVIYKHQKDALKAFLTLSLFETKDELVKKFNENHKKIVLKNTKRKPPKGKKGKAAPPTVHPIMKSSFYCRFPKSSPFFSLPREQVQTHLDSLVLSLSTQKQKNKEGNVDEKHLVKPVKSILCYRCQSYGHYAYSCPKKKSAVASDELDN